MTKRFSGNKPRK